MIGTVYFHALFKRKSKSLETANIKAITYQESII